MSRRTGYLGGILVVLMLGAGCGDGGNAADTSTDDAGADAQDGDATAPDSEADVAEAEAGPDVPAEADADADADAEVDDAADASEEDAGPEDAEEEDGDGGEPLWSGILCGFGVCETPEVCCITAEPASEECTADDACSGDLALTCDGPEDCPEGERCCLPSGAVARTSCAPSCPAGPPLCHTVVECDDGDSETFDYCHPAMCTYPGFERGTICVHSRGEQCTDAVDNDGDTLIDVEDPDCATFPC